jgi:hypothetical protein
MILHNFHVPDVELLRAALRNQQSAWSTLTPHWYALQVMIDQLDELDADEPLRR